jgi:hypothetical protein
MGFRKDESLDELARVGNVAQFASFAPSSGGRLEQQFSRIASHEPNHLFETPEVTIESLLRHSAERSINLRSFTPERPQSRHFYYGIQSSVEAHAIASQLSAQGLFVIANETVDVADGGVSGVFQGGVIEFAPDDTPRCVEKPGVASLPAQWGLAVIRRVYGFEPEIVDVAKGRLEFSIHPKPRGWRQSHTLMWEYEPSATAPMEASLTWPNRFSRHIGDKVFGLLIAEIIKLPVPLTTVIPRRVAPFTFGQSTGSLESWTRTCAREPEPGRFTTKKGWIDPFRLLQAEDPEGEAIAAVLCQSAVVAKFSGAAITDSKGNMVVEGIRGEGDRFMLGQHTPERLPSKILSDVKSIFADASRTLDAVRFEWVHDGDRVWIVQLHRGGTEGVGSTLVPGEATEWAVFEAAKGLEELRRFLNDLPDHAGVRIEGEVGLTSHIADLLRKSKRPARLSKLTHA